MTALIALISIVVIAAIVFAYLRSRSRQQGDETRARDQQAAEEQVLEFSLAVDHTPHFRTAAEAADSLANVLLEHLWLPVLAVYAGRHGDTKLVNTLRTPATEAKNTHPLPPFLDSSAAKPYSRPTLATFDTSPFLASERSEQASTAIAPQEGVDLTTTSAERAKEQTAEAVPQPHAEASEEVSGQEDDLATQSSQRVAAQPKVWILPWRGPFNWGGLIVAGTQAGVTFETLERFRSSMGGLTDRLAAALEIETESQRLQARDESVSRVVEFARSLISCLDEPAPLVSISREVARLVGADSAALWRLEQGSPMIRMAASHGLRSAEFLPLPVGQGLAGTVAESGDLLAIENAPADPRCIFPREARESGIASYLGAPVKSDGNIIAVVEAHTSEPHDWQDDQRQALEAAAAIIAQLVKSTDARGDRLRVESAYLGLSEALQRLRSRDEVLEAVAEVLGHALGVSRALIVEFGDQGEVKPVKQEYRLDSVKSALGAVFAPGFAERVNASGSEPIAIGDSREHPLAGVEAAAEFQILSELALPVRVEGETCAVVYLHQSDRLREWRGDEVEFADRVARQLGLSLANARAFEAANTQSLAAREDARQARLKAATAEELQKKIDELERAIASARSGENQARTMLAHASGLEAKARNEADTARQAEAEARHEGERLAADCVRARKSAQQLLEINRLKSEFIVSAGREIDASLQSVLGLAEMLEQGSYGALGPEQLEAVRGIYNWGRRVKSDVDWLIEYGSARSRRLEATEEVNKPGQS
ncbi:MAG TPA: GAF domain-containing protein [Blastocatellia bacterium]|nr:GAF domain-containing protein [Blastocatellia bacterium]